MGRLLTLFKRPNTDSTAPSGYSVAFTTDPISDANAAAAAFQFAGAETGCTFNYTINSSGGGTEVTGSGSISSATQSVTGINVSGLTDGTLTLSVTLTDGAGNTGTPATDTVVKAFVPTDISGLSLWLDASDAATITQVAGAVSQWNDKSGQANHATQGTGAAQPITGTRTINSKNAIDFDGTDDFMSLPAGVMALTGGSYTLLIVAAMDSDATTFRLWDGAVGGATRATLQFGTASYSYQNRSTLSLTATSITRNTNAHATGFVRSGVNITGFHDGVAGTAGTNAENITITPLYLGKGAGGTANPVNGMIAEVFMYNAALSNANLNKLGAYVAAKWGVTWTGL